jgi:hypothetical protein
MYHCIHDLWMPARCSTNLSPHASEMRSHRSFQLTPRRRSHSILAPKCSNNSHGRSCVMIDPREGVGRYGTAAGRWAGIGPYYAMFPAEFADQIVLQHTAPGDAILDPFAGRGTSTFSAAVHGRRGIGVELNPVGWVYARAKLHPAAQQCVEQRFNELGRISQQYHHAAANLPPFFHHCFSPHVLEFLLAAREELNWRHRPTDWTAMALLLVHFHGKRPDSLSNRMRQTKSMSPDYAVRWWQERGLAPPEIDPVEFMLQKLTWRYGAGRPQVSQSHVYLGDSLKLLPKLAKRVGLGTLPAAKLLLTSPPYFSITNYHYDQWLRLWLLGGAPSARRIGGEHRGKFEHPTRYRGLLRQVFSIAAAMLATDAVVYVRTDRRAFTYQATLDALRYAFPSMQLHEQIRPFLRPTQTALFGDREAKVGEVDLILAPKRAL